MLRSGFTVLLIIVVFLFSGCASIVSKSYYPVAILSSPDQTDFIITNKNGENIHCGKTPSSVTLKSSCGYFNGEMYNITFRKEGYSPNSATISSSLDSWYFGNILVGGLIGSLIIDPSTGAMWKLPSTVSATMIEEDTALKTPDKTLHTINLSSIPDSEKNNLNGVEQ